VDRVTLSPDGAHFQRRGQPFFYLADTVWSAFTNPTLEEWREYLEHRRLQGFTALQINVLPQWDRTPGYEHPEPFARTRGGAPDFAAPNSEYFERARTMCAMAVERGFVPALVVLWCDYVPGTWGAAKVPGHAIPMEQIEEYCRHVARTFAEYGPLYLVSGDTDLKSSAVIQSYLAALRAMKKHDPQGLTTFHLQPEAELPEQIAGAPELDFYMYQSGHHAERQELAYRLAERFAAMPHRRPVVNGEPCYEGHGFGYRYGRFGAFEVRRAMWQGLLAGGGAGVTYGAHGIWSWHAQGKPFPPATFSGTPFPWRTALRLPGAWDAGLVRWAFERYELFGLQPAQELLRNGTPEIRLAVSPERGKLVLYLPYNVDVEIGLDLSGYHLELIELGERRICRPEVSAGPGGSTVGMHPGNEDALIVATKEE
jgi:hypothetical protein